MKLFNFLQKAISEVGLKPVTDLIAGRNGLLSVLKESSDPKSKISSRKSGASALLFGAVTMALTMTLDWKVAVVICAFTVCGSALLALTAWNKK